MDTEQTDRSRYLSIIHDAFGKESLDVREEAVCLELLAHVDRYGLSGRRPEDGREEVIRALDATVAQMYGTSLHDLMNGSRSRENVTRRAFCWDRYRSFFPLDSLKKLSQRFGGRERISMQYVMSRFQDWLNTEPETACQYETFKKEFSEQLSKIV